MEAANCICNTADMGKFISVDIQHGRFDCGGTVCRAGCSCGGRHLRPNHEFTDSWCHRTMYWCIRNYE